MCLHGGHSSVHVCAGARCTRYDTSIPACISVVYGHPACAELCTRELAQQQQPEVKEED